MDINKLTVKLDFTIHTISTIYLFNAEFLYNLFQFYAIEFYCNYAKAPSVQFTVAHECPTTFQRKTETLTARFILKLI